MLGLCGDLKRTDFNQFPLWVGVVVLNELILTVSISEGVVFLIELFLPVSTLGGYGGLERCDFSSF